MTTHKKDLRDGRPLWLARPMRRLDFARLDADATTDALIIGAGVSGAFVAEALADAGLSVIVADRRRAPLLGSTPASTALVQHDIDTPLTLLARKIGTEKAMRAWRRSFLAVSALHARTRELAIDCDIEERNTLYLAGDVLDAKALAVEGEARRLAGLETVHLGRAALRERFGVGRAGALMSFGNFAVDPRRLAAGFLRAAVAKGARIHAPCDIVDVEAKTRIIVARAANGRRIRCRYLVFATGYELAKQIPRHGHRIASTFALATRSQPRRLWPERCLIWEASEPYLYMRSTMDGRVICGGEDEDFVSEEARNALLPTKVEAIRRKLGALFPALDTRADFAWCGSFGVSATGLPSIGLIPGMKNCWAVLGYGGNGITYSRIAAEIIRAGVLGKRDPDADLYAFSR